MNWEILLLVKLGKLRLPRNFLTVANTLSFLTSILLCCKNVLDNDSNILKFDIFSTAINDVLATEEFDGKKY